MTLHRQLIAAGSTLEAGQFGGFCGISVGGTGRIRVMGDESQSPAGETNEQLWRAIFFRALRVRVHFWLQNRDTKVLVLQGGARPWR